MAEPQAADGRFRVASPHLLLALISDGSVYNIACEKSKGVCMQNRPYWERGMLDIPFKQENSKENFDKLYLGAYGGGQCFGICLVIKEKITANPSRDPVSIVKDCVARFTDARRESLKERGKNKKLLFRTHVTQHLQDYLSTSGLRVRSEVTEDLIFREISDSGAARIVMREESGGHALLIIKDRVTCSYRIFDPNYGLSKPMPIDSILLQLNMIKRFYGFDKIELDFYYGYKSSHKDLIQMLLGINPNFLSFLSKSHSAKPYHIVEIITGHVTKDAPKLSAAKIYKELGDGLIKHLILRFIYEYGFLRKESLDDENVDKRLDDFGFKKEASYLRELLIFKKIIGDSTFFEIAEKGHVEMERFIRQSKEDDGLLGRICLGMSMHPPIEEVRLLISWGVDVNSRSNNGETALHIAAKMGYKEIVKLLVASGAFIYARNDRGETAIDVASDPEIKKILLAESKVRQLLSYQNGVAKKMLGEWLPEAAIFGVSSMIILAMTDYKSNSLLSTVCLTALTSCGVVLGCNLIRDPNFFNPVFIFCKGLYNKVFAAAPSQGRQI